MTSELDMLFKLWKYATGEDLSEKRGEVAQTNSPKIGAANGKNKKGI